MPYSMSPGGRRREPRPLMDPTQQASPLLPLQTGGAGSEMLRQLGYMLTMGSRRGERDRGPGPGVPIQEMLETATRNAAAKNEEQYGNVLGDVYQAAVGDLSAASMMALQGAQGMRGPQRAAMGQLALELQERSRQRSKEDLLFSQEQAERSTRLEREGVAWGQMQEDRQRQLHKEQLEQELVMTGRPMWELENNFFTAAATGMYGPVGQIFGEYLKTPSGQKEFGGQGQERINRRHALARLLEEIDENPAIAFSDEAVEQAFLGAKRTTFEPTFLQTPEGESISTGLMGALANPDTWIAVGPNKYMAFQMKSPGAKEELRNKIRRYAGLGTSEQTDDFMAALVAGDESKPKVPELLKALQQRIFGFDVGRVGDVASITLAQEIADLLDQNGMVAISPAPRHVPGATSVVDYATHAADERGEVTPYRQWKVNTGLWSQVERHTGTSGDLVMTDQGLAHKPAIAHETGLTRDEATALVRDLRQGLKPFMRDLDQLRSKVESSVRHRGVELPQVQLDELIDLTAFHYTQPLLEYRESRGKGAKVEDFWEEVAVPSFDDLIENYLPKAAQDRAKEGAEATRMRQAADAGTTVEALRMANDQELAAAQQALSPLVAQEQQAMAAGGGISPPSSSSTPQSQVEPPAASPSSFLDQAAMSGATQPGEMFGYSKDARLYADEPPEPQYPEGKQWKQDPAMLEKMQADVLNPSMDELVNRRIPGVSRREEGLAPALGRMVRQGGEAAQRAAQQAKRDEESVRQTVAAHEKARSKVRSSEMADQRRSTWSTQRNLKEDREHEQRMRTQRNTAVFNAYRGRQWQHNVESLPIDEGKDRLDHLRDVLAEVEASDPGSMVTVPALVGASSRTREMSAKEAARYLKARIEELDRWVMFSQAKKQMGWKQLR